MCVPHRRVGEIQQARLWTLDKTGANPPIGYRYPRPLILFNCMHVMELLSFRAARHDHCHFHIRRGVCTTIVAPPDSRAGSAANGLRNVRGPEVEGREER